MPKVAKKKKGSKKSAQIINVQLGGEFGAAMGQAVEKQRENAQGNEAPVPTDVRSEISNRQAGLPQGLMGVIKNDEKPLDLKKTFRTSKDVKKLIDQQISEWTNTKINENGWKEAKTLLDPNELVTCMHVIPRALDEKKRLNKTSEQMAACISEASAKEYVLWWNSYESELKCAGKKRPKKFWWQLLQRKYLPLSIKRTNELKNKRDAEIAEAKKEKRNPKIPSSATAGEQTRVQALKEAMYMVKDIWEEECHRMNMSYENQPEKQITSPNQNKGQRTPKGGQGGGKGGGKGGGGKGKGGKGDSKGKGGKKGKPTPLLDGHCITCFLYGRCENEPGKIVSWPECLSRGLKHTTDWEKFKDPKTAPYSYDRAVEAWDFMGKEFYNKSTGKWVTKWVHNECAPCDWDEIMRRHHNFGS